MIALEGKDLAFSYIDSPVLFSNVNIQVKKGECVALTGASGSGKSTLCHILAGIIPRSIEGNVQGKVFLLGDEIQTLSLVQTVQRVGMLFQNPDSQLFSPTVEDEIAFGPENLCLPREEIARRIAHSLQSVQMSEFRQARTNELSQGQKQLVALAAVLALEPKVLIFDEALAPLDSHHHGLVQEIIKTLKRRGKVILIVEHDPEEIKIVDRVYELRDRRIWEVYK